MNAMHAGNRNRRWLLGAGVGAALIGAAVLAEPAQGAQNWGINIGGITLGNDLFEHSSRGRSYSVYAGTLTIDGRCFRIRASNAAYDVYCAFRRAGYYARRYTSRGVCSVAVRGSPCVQWSPETYDACFTRDCNSLRVTLTARAHHHGGHDHDDDHRGFRRRRW